jgi:hypothetical protein
VGCDRSTGVGDVFGDIHRPVGTVDRFERTADLCPVSAEDADPLPAVIVDCGDDRWQHWGCAHCGISRLSLPECILK